MAESREKLKIPKHVGIIMDGNGRWAEKKGLPRIKGHHEGVKSVESVIKKSIELKIKYLTIYAFSTENWKRPKKEVKGLIKLFKEFIKKKINKIKEQKVKLNFIGKTDRFPQDMVELTKKAEKLSKENNRLILNIALNYSGRSEIIKAAKEISKRVKEGKMDIKDINENVFNQHLYTKEIPDPDLIIRTSGEKRLSNFLSWQSAYSEFYFPKTYWPDFREKEFLNAIKEYSKRDRRFGAVKENN
ncbi:MAG: isoprenyl transferase [Candidatus Woesearchaeota archaeon]